MLRIPMFFRNPYAVIGGGIFATAWLMLCGLLGYALLSRGDANAIWLAAIFGTPSSLIFGEISRAVARTLTGDPNLYIDFLFIALGGAIQYCALGVIVG